MKGVETTTENLVQQLETAVKTGDVKNSQTLIALLAKQKVLIKIDLIPRILADTGYDITIYMEDRVSSAPPFLMKINSQTTAGDLKKLVCLKHSFPVQVQRLIVSQKVPKDEDVLSKLGVKEGSTIYIYLVPAHKVNLTKDQFQEELASFMSGPKSGIMSRQPFYLGPEMGASHSLTLLKPVEQEKIGWKCPSCTYINLPHRPGCEMCASTRPTDYQIPENYELSQKEIDWRNMEHDAFLAHKQISQAREPTRSLSPSLLQEHPLHQPQPMQ